MCNFFSFNSDGDGQYWYFSLDDIRAYKASHPAWQREKREGWQVPGVNFHSHSFIAEEKCGKKESDFNTYEFYPSTGTFVVDAKHLKKDDATQAEAWVRSLFKKMGEEGVWEYYSESFSLAEKIGEIPTREKVLQAIKRAVLCKWFKPMSRVPKGEAETTVRLACKLFGIEAEVEYRKLQKSADWDAAWGAARGAARGAAWDAAWGAAWGAAWEVAGDQPTLLKRYPQNPFAVLMDLWEMGFYVCGVRDGKFILYYVPQKK